MNARQAKLATSSRSLAGASSMRSGETVGATLADSVHAGAASPVETRSAAPTAALRLHAPRTRAAVISTRRFRASHRSTKRRGRTSPAVEIRPRSRRSRPPRLQAEEHNQAAAKFGQDHDAVVAHVSMQIGVRGDLADAFKDKDIGEHRSRKQDERVGDTEQKVRVDASPRWFALSRRRLDMRHAAPLRLGPRGRGLFL